MVATGADYGFYPGAEGAVQKEGDFGLGEGVGYGYWVVFTAVGLSDQISSFFV